MREDSESINPKKIKEEFYAKRIRSKKKSRYKSKKKNLNFIYEFLTNRKALQIKRKKYKKLKRWAIEQSNLANDRLFHLEAMENLLLNKREELADNHRTMEQFKAHITALLRRENKNDE